MNEKLEEINSFYFEKAMDISEGHILFLQKLLKRDKKLVKEFDKFMMDSFPSAWAGFKTDPKFRAFLKR
jgi:hypothetical protein